MLSLDNPLRPDHTEAKPWLQIADDIFAMAQYNGRDATRSRGSRTGSIWLVALSRKAKQESWFIG